MHRITADTRWPLHGVAASREIERLTQATLPAHSLMRRAGHSVSRLARAIAPHGRHAWIACGPGNNGGDGFEAALQLQRLGWQVSLTWTGSGHEPVDAQAARGRALKAGLEIAAQPPQDFDIAVDALLGLGGDLSAHRAGTAAMAQWLTLMHGRGRPVVAVDLPTGLNGDTGQGGLHIQAKGERHTLSLLTLKPGLFTALGRDQAGQIWFDPLGADLQAVPATAELIGASDLPSTHKARESHASHKGSFGDVVVIGGVQTSQGTSMAGAALLAARAALHAGAGRVYVSLLGHCDLRADLVQPELMFRPLTRLSDLPAGASIVCGCGGGSEVASVLSLALASTGPLVLDADALNAIAEHGHLRRQLQRRPSQCPTVLTPHPLEAARLLGCTARQVQDDRLQAAQTLAAQLGGTVVLKGSGSVIAAASRRPQINPTGNALLATAGTGDVLAGMIGAALARGLSAWDAARLSVHRHGASADAWARCHPGRAMTASDLMRSH